MKFIGIGVFFLSLLVDMAVKADGRFSLNSSTKMLLGLRHVMKDVLQ